MDLEFLIISATLEEATPTLAALRRRGFTFTSRLCGIGPLAAAKSASSLQEAAKGKRVLYLGSAGCFDTFHEPYLLRVERVWWLPTGERMGYAKCMPHLYPPLELPASKRFELPTCDLLTSTSVSFNAAFAPNLPKSLPLSCDTKLIENMEAYAIVSELLTTAGELDVLMGVTNAVGPAGSEQWLKNWRQVAQLTADFVEATLCP